MMQSVSSKGGNSPPDLHDAINILCNLGKERNGKEIGEIFVASLALLYHLKVDQATIRTIRSNHDDVSAKAIPFPQPEEIPAMMAVIHNQSLFKALVSCLSCLSTTEDSPHKRSSVAASSSTNPMKKQPTTATSVELNLRILASTILFVSLEEFNHWPVPLVKAYAEDSFGPRLWVDLKECKLLVQNLALVHLSSSASSASSQDPEIVKDASKMADFYRSQQLQQHQLKRGGSHASHSSFQQQGHQRARAYSTDSTGVPFSKTSMPSTPSSPVVIPTTNNNFDSDSGDDEEVAIATVPSKDSNAADDDSSSGEDEEELVIAPAPSFEESPSSKLSYPVSQRLLLQKENYDRIRERYFGDNLGYARDEITLSLQQRLQNKKSKQNSGLLQSLPSFTSVPTIITLISENLEKWLHSPALAGLARQLFAQTVKQMKLPPSLEDLQAIDNILAMQLKANLLNAHVENVTLIATNMPTLKVSQQIYSRLLRQLLLMSDNPATSTNTPLKMIHAVYNVFPKKLSATGMAHAFMSMLVSSVDEELTQGEKVKRLRALIRTVANELGPALDAGLLIQSLMETKEGNSLEQQHDKARLLFQCATLVARRRVEFSKKTKEASSNELLKETLIQSKRCLLQWCCRSYASVVVAAATTNPPPSSAITTNKLKLSPGQVGAGPADYSSILDGLTDHKFPFWLTVMRSVLFLEKANSIRLKEFLLEEDDLDQEEAKRIELCYTLGGDLDNDMIWTILESLSRGEMPPKMALTLLEHLFESCQKQGQGKLVITDVNILRELYTLVPYVPPKSLLPKQDQQIDVEIKDADDKKNEDDNDKLTNRYTHMNTLKEEIPQLAYPGMWWRVTGLALIICGTAPQDIGAVAWKEHPTLRALIKMVTSDRYRFPTVDCDVTARDEMLKTEQAMRGREAKITEALFGNTNKHAKSKRKKMIEPSLPRGSRMSKRQKEKREKQLKKQREKEAAAVAAEANRRKKMLRAAQKSIMLWDPTGGARKPPKESVDLILSVSELFDLPRAFQQTTEPDFLLLTIGNTTRGAIERAYDWLIPIVSFLPTTIARLPASASCFLLLRAYGTEGEERAQLQELSVPLLVHVRDSLTGKFGEANAVRAFDLLLTDAASHNPDRRRCARRVLHDAIGKDESISLRSPEQDIETFQNTNYAWMIKMLSVEHTSSVISDAIKCIYRAASFERGRTLRFHVVALQHLTNYAIDKKIGETWNYPSMLIDLISKRPTVFAATMGSFPDLQSMAIRIAHDEFRAYIISDSTKSKGDMQDEATVKITLYNEGASSANHANGDSKDDGTVQATLPLSLLQSSCVLLSIYLDDDKDLAENQTVRDLVKMLMREEQAYQDGGDGDNSLGAGLSSARIAGSGKSIVPVESWVMLARSRSDFIAKRAALAAPTGFLPRLLLCSGLPRASLLTMIDRLGKVGDNASDMTKTFNQLLVSSAASEWDIGRLGHRREVSRKLLGRLSAYSRMYELSTLQDDKQHVSFTFLRWLSESCKCTENTKHQRKIKSLKRPKQVEPANSGTFGSIESVQSVFKNLPSFISDDNMDQSKEVDALLKGDASNMVAFRLFDVGEAVTQHPQVLGSLEVKEFLGLVFERNETHSLETWLDNNFGNRSVTSSSSKKRKFQGESLFPKIRADELSFLLLNAFSSLERRTEAMGCCILKWVPKLSMAKGSAALWNLLFLDGQKPYSMWKNLISRCCECWSHSHVARCRDWILSHGNDEELDLDNTLRLLVHASAMCSIHVERFSDDVVLPQEDTAWGRSEESVVSAVKLALDGLLKSEDGQLKRRLRSRNDPPESLVLLLLIARLGKKQVKCISKAIIERINDTEEQTKSKLLAVILRVYAYFPHSMHLGVAILRSVLKSAVESYATDWLCWRSPMDDQFQDMFDSVIANGGHPRLVQALSEGAKKHPLLLLRKLPFLEQALAADAVACQITVANERRGILFGHNPNGPLIAKMDGSLIRLTVKHWGYNFTENIWMAFLDITSAIPREVLFGCGLKMGILDFLGVYLRLIFIQTQLQINDRFPRLKSKVSEFLDSFKNSNKQGWDVWLDVEVEGLSSLGSARNVLMSCDFISHQQAIDSVKESKKRTSPESPPAHAKKPKF